MARGTFANIRLVNKLVGRGVQTGPSTVHLTANGPSKPLPLFEAAELYRQAKVPLIVLAGKEYGCGSSRDWAAKGPYLLVSQPK